MANHSRKQDALAKRLAWVDGRLEKTYGPPPHRRREEPLTALVKTILSQNTSGVNSGRAFEALRKAFPEWRDVLEADVGEVEQALRPGGLAKTKACRIQAILEQIAAQGTLSLDHLNTLPGGEAERLLLAYRGVGYKTARCVLLFAMGRDVFPIDTHVLRVLKRLGVIDKEMSADKAHECVGPSVPRGRALALHVNLIRHGRRVCRPREPACHACCLRERCAHYAATVTPSSP